MKLPYSILPPKDREWVAGVEPAWTALEPAVTDALIDEPTPSNGPIRLADDLTDEELAGSAFVSNAMSLLHAITEGDGLTLTSRGNLTRANVSAMREAMNWPGCQYEENQRTGKVLSEHYVEELHLLRALLEEAGLVEQADRWLRATGDGRAALVEPRGPLQATLFRIAFWRVSLNLFGAGAFGSWPQQQIGMALWAISSAPASLDTATLMRLSVLPDEAVLATDKTVAPILFALRVLRPLQWFGLLKYRDAPDPVENGRWCKSALFDRFVRFDKRVVRIHGAFH